MKKRICVAEYVESYLGDMGYSVDENGEVTEQPRSEVRSRAMRARVSDGDATKGIGSEMKAHCDELGGGPADLAPSKYYTLDSLSIVLLNTQILLALGPDLHNANAARKQRREVAESTTKEFSLRRV